MSQYVQHFRKLEVADLWQKAIKTYWNFVVLNIAWHWVLYTHYLEKNEVGPTPYWEEEWLPDILHSRGSFYRTFPIFFLCVWGPPPTYHKIKATSNVRREGGTEEGREGQRMNWSEQGKMRENEKQWTQMSDINYLI